LLTLSLVALLALAAVPPAAGQEGTSADVPLVRLRDGHRSDLLFRVNPRTLQQVGRPIRTFRNGAGLGFSPGGTRIAYSGGNPRRFGIQIVDLARWRSLGIARPARRAQLSVGWASEDRVVAWTQYAERPRIFWIDARTRRVVARRSFSGWAMDALAVPAGLALALAPREGLGPLRIMVVEPNGGARTITVDGIKAGSDHEQGGEVLTPAVTVDPQSGRMYVVAARGLLVAEVDLASGAVAYHSLGASASKGDVDVWWRTAAWAGDGRIAVTGDHWPPVHGRQPSDGPVPLGVRLIDTVSWSIATLDRRPDSMHVAGGTILAAGTRWLDGGRRSESTGLLAFDESGHLAFTRFRRLPVALLGSRGHCGYVWLRHTRTAHVLDLRTGRTLHTIRTGPRAPFLLSP
jgi:hypothetical protein